MKSKLYCKILALCVVCSFIGIGIQPTFAVDIKQSISNGESEECGECRELSKVELVKLKTQMKRLEKHTKLLLVLSKDIPEVNLNYKELSIKISKLIDRIENLPYSEEICPLLILIWVLGEEFINLAKENITGINIISLSLLFGIVLIYCTKLLVFLLWLDFECNNYLP